MHRNELEKSRKRERTMVVVLPGRTVVVVVVAVVGVARPSTPLPHWHRLLHDLAFVIHNIVARPRQAERVEKDQTLTRPLLLLEEGFPSSSDEMAGPPVTWERLEAYREEESKMVVPLAVTCGAYGFPVVRRLLPGKRVSETEEDLGRLLL